MAETPVPPKIMRRYLATSLRQLREAAGFKQDAAAARLGLKTTTTITHHETARNLPKVAELEILLTFYGAPDRIPTFVDLLKTIRAGKDWWEPHQNAVPAWWDLFLGLETSAVRIASYDAATVPGLLQTPEYAEAIIRAGQPDVREGSIGPRISLRMARQEILYREQSPPKVWTVLDEAVLHRVAGSVRTTRDQFAHLLKMAALPQVDIQVLPFSAGQHPGADGTFTVLDFDSEMLGGSVAYTENRLRGSYHEKHADVVTYTDTLSRLQVAAATQKQSRAIIQRQVDVLTKELE